MTLMGSASLSPLALAWLAEIGVSPDLLAHHRPPVVRDHPAAALKALREAAAPRRQPPAVAPEAGAATPVTASPETAGHEAARLPDSLAGMQDYVQTCRACTLHEQRHLPVYGMGDVQDVDWMVIAEAPGKEDDRHGLPFRGEAGALLMAMLASVGRYPQSLDRDDVAVPPGLQPLRMYFTQLVKCRPLGHRGPQPDQIAACRAILMQQIRQVAPRHLLLLGAPAATALLQTDAGVDALRQQVHTFEAPWGDHIPALVTWHPAALLLRPQNKPLAWADMRHLQAMTESPAHGRGG